MAPRPFPTNAVQTAISISYKNAAYSLIADQALPRQPVGAYKFSWNRWPIQQAYTVPPTAVGRRGRLNRVEPSATQETGEIHDYGLEASIPISDIKDAEAMRAHGLGIYDPINAATETLTDLILLDREIRVASIVQDPNNYAPSRRLALAGSNQFSDPTSDIIQTIKNCLDSSLLLRPNTLTMGRDVWGKISSHPHLVNAVKGNVTTKGIITPDDFVKLFEGEGLRKILIGEAVLNVARPGQAASFQRVWGNGMMFTFINPVVRPESGATYGMTAEFGSRIAGSWEDKDIGLDGGIVVRVGERVREIVTAPEAGFLLQNVVA